MAHRGVMVVSAPGSNQYVKRRGRVAAVTPLASLLVQAGSAVASAVALDYTVQPPDDDQVVIQALAVLSWSESAETQQAVAVHPLCPVSVLRRLSDSPRDEVCVAVAGNPGCPDDVLDRLARREWAYNFKETGRRRVAYHERTPAQALLYLAKASVSAKGQIEGQVAIGVARNPGCQPECLRLLLERGAQPVRRMVLSNPSCPLEVLQRQAVNGDWEDRAAVASNRSCPPDLLRQLARNASASVRTEVAYNPATPTDMLVRMVQDRHQNVVNAALVNPALPAATLAMWQLAHGGASRHR